MKNEKQTKNPELEEIHFSVAGRQNYMYVV
jgi:hypothetical protein